MIRYIVWLMFIFSFVPVIKNWNKHNDGDIGLGFLEFVLVLTTFAIAVIYELSVRW